MSFIKNWFVNVIKEPNLGREIASWKMKLDNEVKAIKEKYTNLEKELTTNNQLLEVSKDKFHSLEKEFHLLKEERDILLQSVSSSSKRLALVTDEKEKVLNDFKIEAQRRKDLEEEIKKFTNAFAYRQKSLVSVHSDFKSIVENLKGQNSVPLSKSLGF